MQVKLLKSIVEKLINKQATPIIDLLVDKKNVNEFSIAKKLNLTINQTRNILYKLSDFRLVSFIRKKDKRKGWYIYFWTLNTHQSLSLLEENLKEELSQLEEKLKNRTERRFYICKTCSLEVSEESALLNDFSCPECEEIYELSEKESIKKELEKTINKIKKEIVFVTIEREKEQEKLEKKKEKVIKKAEKDKIETRKKKRLLNKKKAKPKKPAKKTKPKKKITKKAKPKKLVKKTKPKKKKK